MLSDLRFALRMMRRAPGFTVMAVVVLALGIGANTAIFSLVNALLLEPLPFAHPEQLVQMYETESAPGSFPLSGPDFPDWKAQSRLFADMTLYNYQSMNLTGSGQPERVLGETTEANFFRLLGVPAALGRTFLPGEDQSGAKSVVVLSHSLWESRFGGDPRVLGRTITLDDQDCTVIGVAPASFRLQAKVQLWTPMDMAPGKLGQRGNHSYSAIGRMKPGVTLAQAQAEMTAIAARLTREYPGSNTDTGAKLYLLRDRLVWAPQRTSLLTLLAVVGLVLLIACANSANLLLARALGRQKEMSIRLALGARRVHILRQLLTEAVLLALIGAAFGAALAEAAVRAVSGLAAFPLPQFNPIQVNGAVLGFTVVLAVGCGVLFGLAPAWQLSRPRINDELTGAGTLAGSGRRRWLSDALIVTEIALSLVLVAGAGLFLQSYWRLRSSALGVDPNHLLTAAINLPDAQYPKYPQIEQFQHRFLDGVRAIPGVEAAALSDDLPLEGGSNGYISLQGQASPGHTLVEWTRISPSYFQTMRIPVLEGRGYTEADAQAWDRAEAVLNASTPPSAAVLNSFGLPVVVNHAFVQHFFAGQNPIGRQFRQGSDGPWLTIQGVARDVAIDELGPEQYPQAYFPTPADWSGFNLEIRSALPVGTLAAQVRRVLAGLDATVPLHGVRTMNQVADESVASEAFQQWLVMGFAALALLLAAAGIYGVMAYLVAARTREIGVRMALGATRGAVVRLVVGRGLRLAAIGIALGVGGALVAGRLVASQLFQVRPADPATLAAAVAVLLLTSFLACFLPARRAAAVDPNQALRVS